MSHWRIDFRTNFPRSFYLFQSLVLLKLYHNFALGSHVNASCKGPISFFSNVDNGSKAIYIFY